MISYSKRISESEAFYSVENGEIVKSGGGQSSYNLPRPFYRYMIENNILVANPSLSYIRENIDGPAYVLNENYEFKLGSKVLYLIGNNYLKIDNKFIASLNGTNNKFQIYRKVYDELDKRYAWFVELYDKNLSGNKLILNIDNANREFILDIEYVEVDERDYLKYINLHDNRIYLK